MLRAFVVIGTVSAYGNVALADSYSDCLRSRVKQVRLRACEIAANNRGDTAVRRARAFRRLGALRAEAGAHARAVAAFDAAITLAPSDVDAFEKRALSQLALGRPADALKDLNIAVTRRPQSVLLYVERGYVHMVAKQYDAAIKDFSAALARNPQHAVALNNRGLAYRKKGDLVRAKRDYTSAIKAAPTYAQAYTNRGHANEAAGDKTAAVADFRQALTFDPKLGGARAGLKRLGAKEEPVMTESLVKDGEHLVGILCGRCHAIGRSGESPIIHAPPFVDLHRRYPLLALREPISRGIAAPHDLMPKLNLTPADIDKIVAYVNSLRAAGK